MGDLWIGDDRTKYAVGDIGFLVRLHNKRRNFSRYELRPHPAREAGTLVPVLDGVVNGGDTDVHAMGIGTIVEATPNGRGKVVRLTEHDSVESALNHLGYPELLE